ncbi:MAG: hypothetical protein QOI12_897 [Alphaproteobacteria bacterium]|jgi:hypothetical protein|nr:hypothetical protein [Alphaproteobacteria bacterium]
MSAYGRSGFQREHILLNLDSRFVAWSHFGPKTGFHFS